MQTITVEYFISEDGKQFNDQEKCLEHEKKHKEFIELFESKIGKFDEHDLIIGKGIAKVTSLPFEAPWLSAFGACLIKISDVKRSDEGTVLFQLADESGTPYEGGKHWVTGDTFYSEWPD